MTEATARHNALSGPSHQQHLTPTEQAILDRIPMGVMRNLVTRVWRLKLRLQFTGWLQYLIPALVATGVFLAGGLVHLIFGARASAPFIVVAAIVVLWALFDLVTVKFRVRPAEALPRRRDSMDLFDLMRARRSCRSFQTRKMRDADRDELLRSVQEEMQRERIGRSAIRFEYVSAPLVVWPTVNASEFLVAIAPLAYDRVAVIDVGRSLQRIVMAATRIGLGTCWIGPGADHASVARQLGPRFDSKRDHIICVCAVGYQSSYIPMFLRVFNRQFRRRLPLASLFFDGSPLNRPLDTGAVPFDRFGRNYEICQWAPSSYNGQTTRAAAIVERDAHDMRRLVRFDFYAMTASRYYAPVAVGIWCANWEMGCEALGFRGRFAVLPQPAETASKPDAGSTYDVSWLLAEPFPAE